MYRTLIVLTLAQAFAMTGPPVTVLLGGIVGTRLAPSANLATLPVAFMIIGTALATIPAALLMSRFGRKLGFISAISVAALAALLAAFAISIEHFWLFCFATLLLGANNAFVQQYRFAVVESVPVSRMGKSLSVLMLAGVVAAWIGPDVAGRLQHASTWGEFSGSFIGLSAMLFIGLVFLCFYRNTPSAATSEDTRQRSLGTITRQRLFILAVGAAAVAYAIMSLLMTATPVSMHTVDNFSFEDTTWVIQCHIMAMFLPSFFSGFLIDKLGARKIIFAGIVLLSICLAIAFLDHSLLHYWLAMVLLGVGWNFLFLGGTTLLTKTYHPSERFKAQALNDFLIFSIQACAALGSGYLLMEFGWNWVVGLSIPWLIVLTILLWVGRKRECKSAEDPSLLLPPTEAGSK